MEQQTGSKSGKEYARVQPQWIQGIRRGDGVGEERFIYLEIKREIRKEECSRKISGEKRLNNLVYA